ncbi:DUF5345 family protein [Niallia sp. HCP3S3_B10]|uniref:DUF5345 family protein n=1 Tax=Niallia sp. HCP3S3_B10 TaxID=3438944 RepID=UPI003F8A1871
MTKDHNQTDKLIEDLQKDWNHLENLPFSKEPSSFFIKEQLQYSQLKKKKAFYKELKLFMVTAVLLLSFLSMIAFLDFQTIVIMEVISIIVAPLLYFILIHKQEGKIFDDRN